MLHAVPAYAVLIVTPAHSCNCLICHIMCQQCSRYIYASGNVHIKHHNVNMWSQ